MKIQGTRFPLTHTHRENKMRMVPLLLPALRESVQKAEWRRHHDCLAARKRAPLRALR